MSYDQSVKLASGSCPTSRSSVFTAVGRTTVLSIDISNPTGSITSVTVWLNGSILFSISLPSFGGVSWNGPQVVDARQAIELIAGTNSCEYNITGVLK